MNEKRLSSLALSWAGFVIGVSALGLSTLSAQVAPAPHKHSSLARLGPVESMPSNDRGARSVRRPPMQVATPAKHAPDPSGAAYILDGTPKLLSLHHDTEVGTGKPVDVYDFVIELQIMNSDGNLEPVGLQIHNFYTRQPKDARHDVNPRNAEDCKIWNKLVTAALQNHDPGTKTWPYVEFVTAVGARTVQTNEDGQVWWSDDIECWGSIDRFRPF